jgi:hypothetical protein
LELVKNKEAKKTTNQKPVLEVANLATIEGKDNIHLDLDKTSRAALASS